MKFKASVVTRKRLRAIHARLGFAAFRELAHEHDRSRSPRVIATWE